MVDTPTRRTFEEALNDLVDDYIDLGNARICAILEAKVDDLDDMEDAEDVDDP